MNADSRTGPAVRERAVSWERVARALGERLRCHGDFAVCSDGHTEATALPDCAFCEDRRAFRLYQRKIGEPVDRGMTH